MDRKIAPPVYDLNDINIKSASQKVLKNDIKVTYHIDSNIELIKLELVYWAGSRYESNKGVSLLTTKVIPEGTNTLSGSQIAEKFSLIGYYYEFSQGVEYMTVTLTGLKKYFASAVKLLFEVINEPSLQQSQIDKHIANSIQNLKINQQKTSFVASTHLKSKLFGTNHYLGKNIEITDFESITESQIRHFYQKRIGNKPFHVFVTGAIDDTVLNPINDTFGSIAIGTFDEQNFGISHLETEYGFFNIEKTDAIQNSIRFGLIAPPRNSADHYMFLLTNYILGGYFGSRLMKNIREEKGLTYGIGSSYQILKSVAYWAISTDVNSENNTIAIQEIKNEINNLKTALVPNDELQRAKNMLLGEFYGSFNTAFELLEKHKAMQLDTIDTSYYNQFVSKIKAITNEEILNIAQQYFDFDKMLILSVGQNKRG